ncbi:outer membrane beta-barrel protein [Flavobacterium sp.]|uniref:outer membrane beta-barrel protein n=1 Tax=Flavobacterium sp. TaxID=239 RepID=UPI00352810CE
MRFHFNIVLFLLVSFQVFSQNKVAVSGRIIDKTTKLPVESATVFFQKISDSTVVDYSISSKNGDFRFEFKPIDYSVALKISFFGYNTYHKTVEAIASDYNFGVIELEEKTTVLEGLQLNVEAPPIVVKTDTLEFNASSFKVRPNANVEALLKQLPGVEIDDEGKITVNGKEVNNILVNGKPFFGKDGKIATQNLPAEMINKVQVTDTKTKEEEISGDSASSNESTINLTIDEDKNKGLFGKATAGYGSNNRYESSLLFNYFKDTQKISVLGSSNNINSVGFSMDEIFDNMGGGRNSSIWVNDNGSFGINGMQFGGNTGITKSNMIGINFADEWFAKKVDPNGSYYFSNAVTDNKNTTKRTNLLPTGSTYTASEAVTKNDVNAHNVSLDFEVKIDSTTTMYISPNLSKSNVKNLYKSNSFTLDENNALLNENTYDNYTESENVRFKNNLYINKKLTKKGRWASLSFRNENNKNTSNLNTQNTTNFYQSGSANDVRNQITNDDDDATNYTLEINYNEPVLDSLSLGFSASYQWKKSEEIKNTFDFNTVNNNYTDFNDILSNTIFSSTKTFNSTIKIQLKKKKIRGRISLGTDILKFDNKANYLGAITQVKKDYMFPAINGYLSWTLAKSKSIYTYYSYNVNLPTARQLLPFQDLANPLNTIIGNQSLKPEERYRLYMNFNNYDYATRSGFYAYFGGDVTANQIVSSTVYDNDFKASTTYENVNKASQVYTGFTVNKSHKKEKRTIKYGGGIYIDYNFDQGLTNNTLYEAKGYSINPRVNFSWAIEDVITIAPSYRYTFNSTDFSNYIIENSNNFRHIFKIETTSYWPKNVVLGNDFGYTYNSNISGGFQKDFYLWNISLGYNFFKDQLLAKVKVYDVLDQNVSARRTISPTAITDAENTVLQQYVMFSLTYKLEKFGAKKKNDNGIIFMD